MGGKKFLGAALYGGRNRAYGRGGLDLPGPAQMMEELLF
jgi:hypothetical protein